MRNAGRYVASIVLDVVGYALDVAIDALDDVRTRIDRTNFDLWQRYVTERRRSPDGP